MLAEHGRVHYNTIRPHSSLGYRPPAPQAWVASSLGCGGGGNRYAHPVSPHPTQQLSDLRGSCTTLTMKLVQKIGQTSGKLNHVPYRNKFRGILHFGKSQRPVACCDRESLQQHRPVSN